MTGSLKDIYRQRVLEHSRAPHNQRRTAAADREVTGFNPLCGDKVTVYLDLQDDSVSDVAFEGSGCAIAMASASMMTEALRGLPHDTALQLIEEFGQMFAADAEPENPRLEEAKALHSVRAYPSRVKCATLAWNTAEAALHDSNVQVTTE
ncbi:MAG: SUF system NifU family Fe-S cluster assembly protein [Gammaproteobacteria bacterium]|nr:SUF system NifU family Fe-S cluster assembly protein [Gammaproteobacteria bacterium]NND53572.1 SUF system NifU family Fe-S cluster assembly protein [Gammaproteobacteria bacterium]